MIMQLATAWDSVALRVNEHGHMFEDERPVHDFIEWRDDEAPMATARKYLVERAARRWRDHLVSRGSDPEQYPRAEPPTWRTVAS